MPEPNWKTIPIDDPKRIDVDLRFTEKQYERLKKGLIPERMEDKWYIRFENDSLVFARSWTGFEIFRARLEKEADGYALHEFQAERNAEKYLNRDDDEDRKTLAYLIARGMLGIEPGTISAERLRAGDETALRDWSAFGRMAMAEGDGKARDAVRAVLFGVAVGDALGVPFEFKSRDELRRQPATGMVGGGKHRQPPGTFSDDASLALCLAETIASGFSLEALGANFVEWFRDGWWSARGEVFDVGIATARAIERLARGTSPERSGNAGEDSNGNGSLMRIAPLLFQLEDRAPAERFETTRRVSAVTHAHVRSVVACFIWLEYARRLLDGEAKGEAYRAVRKELPDSLRSFGVAADEIARFDRILNLDISELPEAEIRSDGYVVHTLEAAFWCLLCTDNFRDSVVKAVNLGEDTDTTAAVVGGLAGLLYGFEGIPVEWIAALARHEDIEDLSRRLGERLGAEREQKKPAGDRG